MSVLSPSSSEGRCGSLRITDALTRRWRRGTTALCGRAVLVATALLAGTALRPLPATAQVPLLLPRKLARVDLEDTAARYGGLLVSRRQQVVVGSGAVVGADNLVLSCGHLVYGDHGEKAQKVRWFWRYHGHDLPADSRGVPLLGTLRFDNYASAAAASGPDSIRAFNYDVVVHYAYQALAGGRHAEVSADAAAGLLSTRAKWLYGYPVGLYERDPSPNPHRFKLHASGPGTAPCLVFRTGQPFFYFSPQLGAAAGMSGGPVFVEGADGAAGVAGVVVAYRPGDAARPDGALAGGAGIRVLDEDAARLLDRAQARVNQR